MLQVVQLGAGPMAAVLHQARRCLVSVLTSGTHQTAAAAQLYPGACTTAAHLHTTSGPRLAADESGASSSSSSTSASQSSSTPSGTAGSGGKTMRYNPLQAALAEADAAGSAGPSGADAVATAGVPGRQRRTWQWYDAADERRQQQEERRRKHDDAGHAHLQNVPQSMKKCNRILKLVRGLHLQEAIYQCKAVPQKAARYVQEALEAARDDAEEKGMDVSLLTVDTVFATRGVYTSRPVPMGKGGMGQTTQRRSHLQVLLKEDANYSGFRARLLTPIMQMQPHGTRRFPHKNSV